MKKFFFILLFYILINQSFAQRHGIFGGIGMDYTVGGQIGNLQTGLELNRHLVGFMYSKKITFSNNKYNPSSEFLGATYQFTTYRERHFQLGIMMRAGFIDDQFFVYIPSLMFDFVFNDYMKFNVNIGARAKLPAYGFMLVFNLPTQRHEFPHSIWID